jgi:hypothetical protein
VLLADINEGRLKEIINYLDGENAAFYVADVIHEENDTPWLRYQRHLFARQSKSPRLYGTVTSTEPTAAGIVAPLSG